MSAIGWHVAKKVQLKVHFAQDAESGCWYIAASDIPGLRVEAETVQDLIRKVEDVAPDLIELNRVEIMAARGGVAQSLPLSVAILPIFDSPLSVAVA